MAISVDDFFIEVERIEKGTNSDNLKVVFSRRGSEDSVLILADRIR